MKLRIVEIICFAALAVFMVITVSGSRGTDKSSQEIADIILEQGDFTSLEKRGENALRKNFSVQTDLFEDTVYYSSDDVMNVDELLIVKLRPDSDADALTSAVNEYVSGRIKIFEGYGDEQTRRLKDCLIKVKGNCFIFAVCENSRLVSGQLDSALEK